MRATKFTLNAFVLVVMIFSALTLFVTVSLTNMADRTPINSYHPIEGTNLSVRYSSLDKNGIYQGSENASVLLLEGTYGYDWGAAAFGNTLYINEYTNTDLGVMLSNLVKIDIETKEKEILYKNAVLRGVCRSGELVCVENCTLSANYPDTNGLCRLYQLASPQSSDTVTVLWLNPETGEAVHSVTEQSGADSAIDKKYLQHTLQEVMG